MAEERASLLDWATGLASDPALRLRFAQEPRAVLDEQGLADVPPADLHHSLPLVTDSVAARLGTEVDATALAAAAVPLDGESAADTLARQFGAATDSLLNSPAVLHDAPEPDPSADHTLQETTMSTPAATPGSTDDHADLLARLHDVFDDLAAHGVSASGNTPEGWLDSVGPDAAHRLLDSYDLGDLQGDAATARTNELFSAALQPPVVDNRPGREAELDAPAADPDASSGADTDLDDVGPAGGGSSAGAEVPDTDLDDLGATGAPAASGGTWTPQPDDPFIGWGDGTGGAGSAPEAAEADLDGFGSSSSSGGDGYVSHGDDPFADTSSADGGSSYDDGSGFAGHENVSAPEPAHEDAGALDAADHGDADPHDAADDSSDYSESFG